MGGWLPLVSSTVLVTIAYILPRRWRSSYANHFSAQIGTQSYADTPTIFASPCRTSLAWSTWNAHWAVWFRYSYRMTSATIITRIIVWSSIVWSSIIARIPPPPPLYRLTRFPYSHRNTAFSQSKLTFSKCYFINVLTIPVKMYPKFPNFHFAQINSSTWLDRVKIQCANNSSNKRFPSSVKTAITQPN